MREFRWRWQELRNGVVRPAIWLSSITIFDQGMRLLEKLLDFEPCVCPLSAEVLLEFDGCPEVPLEVPTANTVETDIVVKTSVHQRLPLTAH